MLSYTRSDLKPVHYARGYSLGQVLSAGLQVVVTDPAGRPFQAIVSLDAQPQITANTDSHGVANFSGQNIVPYVRDGKVAVTVQSGGLIIKREVPVDQAAFVVIPMCAPSALLTVPEMIALAAGGGCVAAGLYKKWTPLQVVGEVLVGAALFTAVYRHSCMT